jgi:small GTP-binding protein
MDALIAFRQISISSPHIYTSQSIQITLFRLKSFPEENKMVTPLTTIQNALPIREKQARRIAFVGLDRAGKTTALKRLTPGFLQGTRPTMGFNTESVNLSGVRFNVFDLGGPDHFQVFWDRFLPQQEAIVFFIDSADIKRVPEVRQALTRALSLLKPGTKVMILANKQDLPNALDIPQLMTVFDLRSELDSEQVKIFAVSAMTGMGLFDAFRWLASTLEIDIGLEKCTIYGFYVYEKNVGIPILASETEDSIMHIDNPMSGQDSSLITGLHSALGNFATEMAETELSTFSFRSHSTGKLYQVVTIMSEYLVCILVTSAKDSNTVTSVIGKTILDFVKERVDPAELLPPIDRFEIPEIIDIIAPFISNINELRENLGF